MNINNSDCWPQFFVVVVLSFKASVMHQTCKIHWKWPLKTLQTLWCVVFRTVSCCERFLTRCLVSWRTLVRDISDHDLSNCSASWCRVRRRWVSLSASKRLHAHTH